MTLEDLYEQLSPIIQEFCDDTNESSDIEVHATAAVLCLAMGAIQQSVEEDNHLSLISLAYTLSRPRSQ